MIHMMIITVSGATLKDRYKNKTYRFAHICTGSAILFFASTAAIAGAIVMNTGDARYDQFTKWFLLMPLTLVFICVPYIAFDRFLHVKLGISIPLPYHAFFGCLLVLPPIAMMIQFCAYSAIVAVQKKVDDYADWKWSFFISIVGGITSTFLFTFNAYYMTKGRTESTKHADPKSATPEKTVDEPEPTQEKAPRAGSKKRVKAEESE